MKFFLNIMCVYIILNTTSKILKNDKKTKQFKKAITNKQNFKC